MIGVPVIAADTDEQAQHLATTQQQKFLSLIRGNRLPLQPPVDSMDGAWNEWERQAVQQKLAASIVGGPNTVRQRSEEHTSELQSLMRISYAVFCLKKKRKKRNRTTTLTRSATKPSETT